MSGHNCIISVFESRKKVYTKFGENYSAINAASEAIVIDPNSEKAFFRRGDARIATKDYEQARDDFKRVIEINKVSF